MELVVRDVGVARGTRRLIDRLSMRVRSGERWAILGPNGAGKTSFLLCLAGLLTPVEGTIACDGIAVRSAPPRVRSRWIGWLAAGSPSDFGLTVRERIALADPESACPEALLDRHELRRYQDTALSHLSAGERQRVELAALEARRAPIWLLDEPAAYLDLRFQKRLVQYLVEASIGGAGIVASCHDLSQAGAFATHVLLMDGKGSAVAGPAQEILESDRLESVYGTSITVVRDAQGRLIHIEPDFASVVKKSA